MNFIYKIKDKYYFFKRNRRYKKFKNLYLPFAFYDDKRDTLEYLLTSDKVDVENSLYESFSNIINYGFIYHYEIKYERLTKDGIKVIKDICHGHNFDEVIRELYNYPESFRIPKKFAKEYSNQELSFLKKLQNYLKIINLKDSHLPDGYAKECLKFNEVYDKKHKTLKDYIYIIKHDRKEHKRREEENILRSYNRNAQKYSSYGYLYTDNPNILKNMKENRGYRIYLHHEFSLPRKGRYFFLMDNEENYHAIIKAKNERVLKFNELTKDMVDYKALGYSSFKKYQEYLFAKLAEDANMWNESFTKDSQISYITYELVKAFIK